MQNIRQPAIKFFIVSCSFESIRRTILLLQNTYVTHVSFSQYVHKLVSPCTCDVLPRHVLAFMESVDERRQMIGIEDISVNEVFDKTFCCVLRSCTTCIYLRNISYSACFPGNSSQPKMVCYHLPSLVLYSSPPDKSLNEKPLDVTLLGNLWLWCY